MTDKGKPKEIDDIDRAHWSDSMRKCLIDKWAPAMDGLPKDITMYMNSSFINLAHYEDAPSPDPITPRSTI